MHAIKLLFNFPHEILDTSKHKEVIGGIEIVSPHDMPKKFMFYISVRLFQLKIRLICVPLLSDCGTAKYTNTRHL